MNKKRSVVKNTKFWILIFSIVYVIAFFIAYILTKNYEFIGYVALMAFLIILVYKLNKKYDFPSWILLGLSLWGIMHMAGGMIKFGKDVLYAYVLVPIYSHPEIIELTIFKYDQFAHFYFYLFATLFLYYLIKPYLVKEYSWGVIALFLIFAGMGVGALNELVEFLMVLMLENTGVGGYYNTLLDIVFNTLGAVLAVLIIAIIRKNGRK